MGRVFVLPCRPGTFQKVSACFLSAEKNLRVLYRVNLTRIHVDGNRIKQIDLSEKGNRHCIKTGAVIDSTGEAVVCRMAGLATIPENESGHVPAIIFPMELKAGAVFSRSDIMNMLVRIKRAVDSGDLPRGSEDVSFVSGFPGEALTVKMNLGVFILPDQPADRKEIEEKANAFKRDLTLFLLKHVDGFDRGSSFSKTSAVLKRAGRRAKCPYVLTGKDVLEGTRFFDAVARGCWPVEKYPFSGGSHLFYSPDGTYYEIPERSLTVSGIDNLFATGKCISADDDAIASARVIGCCLSTGEGAARLVCKK
jgi:hypothetical protein